MPSDKRNYSRPSSRAYYVPMCCFPASDIKAYTHEARFVKISDMQAYSYLKCRIIPSPETKRIMSHDTQTVFSS